MLRRLRLLILCLLVSSAYADIRDTKHNLTGKGAAGGEADRRKQSREVCVFCHTPGVAELAELAKSGQAATGAPLAKRAAWQKSIETTFSFELFDDIGRTGADFAGGDPVGSVSVACLSCHDTVQALGIVQGGTSDHPFGVPYRGVFRQGDSASRMRDQILSGMSGENPGRSATYIADDSEFRPVRSGVVNKRQVWWAAVTDTGQRTKNDLPLYPRRVDGVGGYEQVPFIECTSCHDPHATREVFLRTAPDQGKLCMTCHIK